jgi:DNA-directed RNA polymerase specialized sigma24 family protein
MAQRTESLLTSDEAMLALVALLVDQREERLKGVPDAVKTEALLGRVGLAAPQIAVLTGKNVEAVRKTLQRQKKPK